MKFYTICILLVLGTNQAISKDYGIVPTYNKNIYKTSLIDTLPPVFMIGQFSDQYEKLSSSAHSLLEVSQNDVYLAYDKWLDMLSELSAAADHSGINLKGTKFWCSVYWNQDGTIKHFAYYPKPGSIPIDQDRFKTMLTGFVSNYKLPIAADAAFYNYGSVAFPIPVRRQVAAKN
ncbi:MAG: hypothetical protein ABI761_09250 [Saprospiraceae bacterium]